MRAAAQTTINGLQCTAAQESDANAECVHVIKGTGLPTGGAHMTYDPDADALWMTNWYSGKLTKFNIAKGSSRPTPHRPVTPRSPWRGRSKPTARTSTSMSTSATGSCASPSRPGRGRRSRSPTAWTVRCTRSPSTARKLWFTVSDEDYDAATVLGYVNLNNWGASQKGVIYTGWKTLSMHPNAKPGNKHSFRGIEVSGNRIALADHGDMAYVTFTKR